MAYVMDAIDKEYQKTYAVSVMQMVFLLNFLCALMCNLDHGSLPGFSLEIKEKMKIGNFGFGMLGTAVYLGLTLGSVIGAKIFQVPAFTKTTLIVAMSFNGLALFAFIFVDNFHVAILLRFLTGFSQVYFCIYPPVWADAYGSEREKSFWITLYVVCVPLGVFLGFSFASVLNKEGHWEWAFVVQAALTIPCIIGLILTDKKWLDI